MFDSVLNFSSDHYVTKVTFMLEVLKTTIRHQNDVNGLCFGDFLINSKTFKTTQGWSSSLTKCFYLLRWTGIWLMECELITAKSQSWT